MSTALAINSILFPSAIDSYDETAREIGSTEPAFSGTLRTSRQAIKRDCNVSSVPMIASDANAWERLIRGEGHHWSFETSLYSSQGLAPVAGYSATIDGTGSKFGSSRLFAGTTISWVVGNYGTGPTIMFWRLNPSGAPTWNHYCYLGNGTFYKDGVLTSTPTPFAVTYYVGDTLTLIGPASNATAWSAGATKAVGAVVRPTVGNGFTYVASAITTGVTAGSQPTWPLVLGNTVVDGGVTWTAQLGGIYVDDLVFLPFTIPLGWLAYLVAATSPWSDLPRLTLTGDVISVAAPGFSTTSPRTVRGTVTSKLTKGVTGGSFQMLRTLAASFQEA